MKKVNYALLLMALPFMISACGGGSTSNANEQEASADDIAAQVEVRPSSEQAAAEDAIAAVIEQNTPEEYRKATWIPNTTAGSSKQLSKASYAPTTNVVSSKVKSNGDNTTGWYVYDADPAGATIASEYDDAKGSNVIRLNGDGLKNGYTLGWTAHDWDSSTNKLMKWSESTNKTIKWSMKYSEDFVIYVRLNTKDGYRYLFYTDANLNYGTASYYDAPHYIHNGLGSASKDGTWKTFTRNLSADLKRFNPNNEIITVDGFFVRGSGLIDDVELLKTNGTEVNSIVYEDAEDGKDSRWAVYDKSPTGATVKNVDDAEKSSKVIEVSGSGTDNGFILSEWNSANGWKNTINKEISWDMKFNDKYVVYISVITANGPRFITYSPLSDETFAANPNYGQGKVEEGGYTYIHLGLNPNTKGGSWKTVSRNLEADLKKYEPNNSLVSVSAFLVRGSGRLDNIKMFDTNADGDYDNSTN